MQDVIIIGGGICGCSLLYELSRYNVKVALLEKENDVGVATTKANSAIVHAGYDPEPGTLMARYNVEGNRLIEQLCADLDVMYKKIGSLVIGFNAEDRRHIEQLYERGIANGVPGMRILDSAELHEMEPALNEEANCALYAPSAGIVSPWELAFAQAEAAVTGGAEVHLETMVTAIKPQPDGHFIVKTNKGDFEARFVVNAAGVETDAVSQMAEPLHFTIYPTRGQYYLMDTTQGEIVSHVIFQCPTDVGKGVLVAPTVHGNLIVGPDSEKVHGLDVTTTADGLQYVRRLAQQSVPGIDFRQSIRNFAGVRAAADADDFIVGESATTPGFFNIAGIKSPGLTSAPSIAKDIVSMLGEAGMTLPPNPNFCANRKVLRFEHLSDDKRAQAVADNPLYGMIVCRCKTVTEGEIVDAMHRPLPPRSVDAVKRRCAPGMGRCQGGFCGPRVQAIIAREMGLRQQDVPLDRAGMEIIIGRTKGEKGGEA